MSRLYFGPDGVIHEKECDTEDVSYVSEARENLFLIFCFAGGIAIGIGIYYFINSGILAEFDAELSAKITENWFWRKLGVGVLGASGFLGSFIYGGYKLLK